MLTNFGKEIRKIRIDRNDKLLDMARKLSVSSSFISAIERGKKKMPKDFIDKLSAAYSLNREELSVVEDAIDKDTKSFVITPANDVEHQTVAMFARSIKTLPDGKLKRIQDILNSENN